MSTVLLTQTQLSTFIPKSHRPEVRGGRLQPTLNTSVSLRSPEHTTASRVLCLGPRSDFVLRLLERVQYSDQAPLFLYYEDLGLHWGWKLQDGELVFLIKNEIIPVRRIYVRGAVIEPDEPAWRPVGDLFAALEAWQGEVWCRPSDQTFNESKIFQMTQSLKLAARRVPEANVEIIPSVIYRGDQRTMKFIQENEPTTTCGEKNDSWIVKSLSGVRSLVVSNGVFQSWNFEALQDCPALFQQRIFGSDVRLHYFNGKAWGIFVQAKSEVDYRYAASSSEMREFAVSPALLRFCREVAEIEGGRLYGFDFILREDGKLFCLEANPGPGWAWYHEREVCRESFLEFFVEELIK